MAKKHGVSQNIITDVFIGRTYKDLLPPPSKYKRICADCVMPILVNHRWRINERSQVVHRICTHPEYRSAEDAMQPRPLALTPLFDALEAVGA